MNSNDITSAVEAILFASGEPVAVKRIAEVLGVPESAIRDSAERLSAFYSYERRGIRLVFLDDSLQLASAPEFADIIRDTLESRKPPKLSQAALEVLSVVAYYQPVTRGYVEQIRGVDSSYTMGSLLERGLIAEGGQLDAPGRPMTFVTTKSFLRVFGLKSLEELPKLTQPGENEEEQQTVSL